MSTPRCSSLGCTVASVVNSKAAETAAQRPAIAATTAKQVAAWSQSPSSDKAYTGSEAS